MRPSKLRFPIVRLVLLLASLLACADATAAEWIKVQSPHFALIGNVSQEQLTTLALSVEEFLPALLKRLPRAHSTAGITIVLFKDDATYEPFKPRYDGVPTAAAGYFLAGGAVNFIAAVAKNDPERVLYHELFHALSRQDSGGPPPSWVKEGLAEFYSTFDIRFGAIVPFHVVTLRTRPWIPLSDVLAATNDSPFYNETTHQGMFYAESWALIRYLMADEGRREQLAGYLSLRSSGKTIAASVEEAFQTDISGLEMQLREYAAQLPVTTGMPELRVHDPNIPTRVSELLDGESMTRLGDLLLHLNRLDAAEELLLRATHENPVFPGTFTALGMLRMRQNRNVEALPFLQRAIEADAENYLAHFYYAAVIQALSATDRPGKRERQMELSRQHLRKATELAPWFVDADRWLGYVAIALHDGWDEAEAALKRAIALEPARADLRKTLQDVQNAFAAHLEIERNRRERESRKHLADALNALRVPNPPVVMTYELWKMPDMPPPKPHVTYPTFDGFLIAIECRDGITLVLRSDERVVRFHTRTPRTLEFTSKVSNAANEASCGVVRPEHRVTVTYRRTTDASSIGEPVRIEYK